VGKANTKLSAPSDKLSHISDSTKRNFRVVKNKKDPCVFCATARLRFCNHDKDHLLLFRCCFQAPYVICCLPDLIV
jgi:hypothetical protein